MHEELEEARLARRRAGLRLLAYVGIALLLPLALNAFAADSPGTHVGIAAALVGGYALCWTPRGDDLTVPFLRAVDASVVLVTVLAIVAISPLVAAADFVASMFSGESQIDVPWIGALAPLYVPCLLFATAPLALGQRDLPPGSLLRGGLSLMVVFGREALPDSWRWLPFLGLGCSVISIGLALTTKSEEALDERTPPPVAKDTPFPGGASPARCLVLILALASAYYAGHTQAPLPFLVTFASGLVLYWPRNRGDHSVAGLRTISCTMALFLAPMHLMIGIVGGLFGLCSLAIGGGPTPELLPHFALFPVPLIAIVIGTIPLAVRGTEPWVAPWARLTAHVTLLAAAEGYPPALPVCAAIGAAASVSVIGFSYLAPSEALDAPEDPPPNETASDQD